VECAFLLDEFLKWLFRSFIIKTLKNNLKKYQILKLQEFKKERKKILIFTASLVEKIEYIGIGLTEFSCNARFGSLIKSENYDCHSCP
jgi:hypothetical protein